MTLPVALSGSDVIGQAKTGTGKTLGFGLPLLERVTVPADVEVGRAKPEQLTEAPQALVVVPTRELCQQVTNDLLTAGKVRNVRVLAIYGGRAYEPQVEALKKGVDVVVGTPGRLLDLAGQRKLNLSEVKSLVLDEADEMLDLGFLPDVERIIQLLPTKRQTMLFSATMPGQVISLARRYMSQPTHIRAAAPDDEGQTVANTTQHIFRAHSMDKPEMVSRILQADGRGLAMVFCRTKRTAADIADQLAKRGFASGAVHGDLGQGAREQALRAFRNGKVDVLVCTDVAARGIDVEGVTHVINYQSPEDEKTYLHRIGRTGRAGAKGTAVTLVDWDDIPRWKLINKALDLPFDEPEETYSTSPHLYELLKIPQGTKGVLPRAERTRAGLAAEEVEDLGETGGRGRGGPRKSAAAAEVEERPQRTRTPRQRRRTRGGTALDGAPETKATGSLNTAEGSEGATEARQPRRRRRTRGAAQGGAGAPAGVQASEVADQVAEAASVAPAQSAGEAIEAPAKPRRRRTRAARPETGEAAAVATAEGTAVAADAVAATDAAEAPAKPRRRTRGAAKAAAETVVESVQAVVDTAPAEDAAPVKPKRTRKTAAAKAAEAAVDTAEGVAPVSDEAAPAKPKRTRKAAATKPAADTTDDSGRGRRSGQAQAHPQEHRRREAGGGARRGRPGQAQADPQGRRDQAGRGHDGRSASRARPSRCAAAPAPRRRPPRPRSRADPHYPTARPRHVRRPGRRLCSTAAARRARCVQGPLPRTAASRTGPPERGRPAGGSRRLRIGRAVGPSR